MARRGSLRRILLITAGTVVFAASALIYWLSGSVFTSVVVLASAVGLGVVGAVVTAAVLLVRNAVVSSRIRRGSRRPYLTPRELPSPPVLFAGRDREIDEARALLRGRRSRRGRPFVLLVHGEPGVGKSGFAIQLTTALLADRPEGGAIYVSLTGAQLVDGKPNGRMRNVMRDLVDSLQGPGDTIPATYGARQAEFRRLGRGRRGRRMLYLFDDARDSEVIAQVMPSRSDALVVVTSRDELTGLNASERMSLKPLARVDAKRILSHLLGQPADASSLEKVVDLAAGYPFAIHLAALAISNQGVWMLPDVLAALPAPSTVAGEQPSPERAAQERMLDLSVAMLHPDQRRTLLSLAALPDGTFVPWMVTAVADLSTEADRDGVGDREAHNICERLADQRLLERITRDATGVVRLRMPDRVRAYVVARAERDLSPADRTAASSRLEAAKQARQSRDIRRDLRVSIPRSLNEGRMAAALNEARSVLTDARDRANNIDASKPPSDDERRALAMLAIVLTELGGLDDALEICQLDRRARVEAGENEDGPRDVVDARLHRCLGRLRRREWKLTDALTELTLARDIAVENEDHLEEVWCLRELAIAESMRTVAGETHIKTAHEYLDRAGVLVERIPNESGIAAGDFLAGRVSEARAIVLMNSSGRGPADQRALRDALDNLTAADRRLAPEFVVYQAWLDYHRARAMFRLATAESVASPDQRQITAARQIAQRAMATFASLPHRYGAARCRLEIGHMYLRENNARAALPLLEEARETFSYSGDRWIEARTAVLLAELRIREKMAPEDAEAELSFAIPVLHAAGDGATLKQAMEARRDLRAYVKSRSRSRQPDQQGPDESVLP